MASYHGTDSFIDLNFNRSLGNMHSNYTKPIAIVKASYSSNVNAGNDEGINSAGDQGQRLNKFSDNFMQKSEYRPISFNSSKPQINENKFVTVANVHNPPSNYQETPTQHQGNGYTSKFHNSIPTRPNNHQSSARKYNNTIIKEDIINTNDVTKNSDVIRSNNIKSDETPKINDFAETNGIPPRFHGNENKYDLKNEFGEVIKKGDPVIEQSLASNEPFNFEQYGYPFGVKDRYYFLDSDLETITEESSVLDSDMESIASKRKLNRQKSGSVSSVSTQRTITPTNSEDGTRSFLFNTPSSTSEKQIDPTAHQRIVYAKCLGPNQNHPTPRQQGKKRASLDINEMFEAAKNNDIEILKYFKHEIGNTVDEDGNSVLHIALKHGNLQCAQFIMKSLPPSSASLLNDDMVTPTALAIQNGHLSCLKWMIANTNAKEELSVSRKQASVDGTNMRLPLIHIAAKHNQEEILTWLCDCMEQENYSIDMADQYSNTAVHEAAKNGHLQCIQTLVGRGASVTVLNSEGDTPCRMADRHGHVTCVGYLVVVETCVSLAQQIVELKSDMKKMESQNKQLLDKIQSQDAQQEQKMVVKNTPSPKITHKLVTNDFTPRFQSTVTMQPINHTTHQLPATKPVSDYNHKTESTMNALSVNGTRRPSPSSAFQSVQKQFSPNTSPRKPKPTSPATNEPSEVKSKNKTVSVFSKFIDNTSNKSKQNSPVKTSLTTPKPENPSVVTSSSVQSPTNRRNKTRNKDPDEGENKLENKEIVEINKNEHRQRSFLGHNKYKRHSKRYDRLSLDEMLRAARDTRHVPSPTVSMCTEDSTMETVEVMRERLAEASRWFMVQQSRGPNGQSKQGYRK